MSFDKLSFFHDFKLQKSALALVLGALTAAACDFGASTFEIVDGGASGDGDGDMGGDAGDGDGDTGDGDGDTGDGDAGDGDGDTGAGGMSGDGDGDTGGTAGDGDGDTGTGGDSGTGGNGTGGDGTGGASPVWDCGPFGPNTDLTLFNPQDIPTVMEWAAGPYLLPDGPDAALSVAVFRSPNNQPNQQEVAVQVRRITDSSNEPLDNVITFDVSRQPEIQEIEQVFRTMNDLVVVARASNYIREYRFPLGPGGAVGDPNIEDFIVECPDNGSLRVVRAAEGTIDREYAATCQSAGVDPGLDSDDELSLLLVHPDFAMYETLGPGVADVTLNIKHYSKVGSNMFLLTGSDTEVAYFRKGADVNQLLQITPIELVQDKWTSMGAFLLPMDGLFFVGAALTPNDIFPADGYAGTVSLEELPNLDAQRLRGSLSPWGTFPTAFDGAHIHDAKPMGGNVMVTGPGLAGSSVWVQVHQRTGEPLVRKKLIDNGAAYFETSAVAPLGFSSVLAYREDDLGKAMIIYCGPASMN